MFPRDSSICLLSCLCFPVILSAGEEQARKEFFERKIRPVLVEKCFHCHAGPASKIKGGLRLDTREGLRKGGESGPAVVAGDTKKSLLLRAMNYDGFEMPPDGKLAKQVVRNFEIWIKAGAFDPRQSSGEHDAEAKPIDLDEGRKFWAFQQPQRRQTPLAGDKWVRTSIDGFTMARMRERGLEPNATADRRALIRRAYFDVTGLPPSPAEVEAFVNDASADAFATVIEHLLSSPHYGERWARLWLDVARYGEDQAHIVGNNKSLFYPNAYRYRDWVISSFQRGHAIRRVSATSAGS